MTDTEADTKIEIRKVTIDELRASPDAAGLFEAHYQEVARNKDVMVLDPNWRAYYALEERGLLMAFAAVAVQQDPHVEVMVGYSLNVITQHMHYAGLRICQNDVLFVAKEWRRGVGRRLIHHTEHEARERGARLMLWHAKEGTDLDRLLPKLGYGVQDIIYSRRL